MSCRPVRIQPVEIRKSEPSLVDRVAGALVAKAAVPMTTFVSLAADFVAAADFSYLAFFESRNVVYKDAGHTQDALAILKRHGLTCVRLRLLTSSAAQAQADPYNYINNLDYTVPLAVRVKNAGLRFMLD